MKPLLLLFASVALASVQAGPSITFVLGSDAPPLERTAAEQLSQDFVKLFEAETSIAEAVPDKGSNVILVGSPKTNSAIKKGWPKDLSEQGQVIQSVDGKLIVGGGSPAATFWAACELGQYFGMRYTLHSDFAPVEQPEFTLAGFDLVLEPNILVRGWRSIGAFGPGSQESWGIAEHQQLLGQLAKLKFNHVTLVFGTARPFVHNGITNEIEGALWLGEVFPVSGETAGRDVFGGAKVFENPDFVGTATYVERLEAGVKLANGIIKKAHELGMTATIDVEAKLAAAAQKTYPKADWPEHSLVTLNLSQGRGGVLPQFSTSDLPGKLSAARDGADGFEVRCAIPGDLNPSVYFLSRAAFDAEAVPTDTLDQFATPICAEGVSARLAMGFAAIEKASALIEKNDPDFALPAPDMFMKHYESGKPAPEWWAEAKGLYGEAVNEMYRSNTRARGGARTFTLYHAKRFTFALHYFTAVESVRAAGIAKAEGDLDVQIENLELAVEAMHNALGIYAEVVQDNSDRGVIALLNEYAYRPMLEVLNTL